MAIWQSIDHLCVPPASYQASWTPSSPARLSLSSVDEVTETAEAPPTIDKKRQWMVSNYKNNNKTYCCYNICSNTISNYWDLECKRVGLYMVITT